MYYSLSNNVKNWVTGSCEKAQGFFPTAKTSWGFLPWIFILQHFWGDPKWWQSIAIINKSHYINSMFCQYYFWHYLLRVSFQRIVSPNFETLSNITFKTCNGVTVQPCSPTKSYTNYDLATKIVFVAKSYSRYSLVKGVAWLLQFCEIVPITKWIVWFLYLNLQCHSNCFKAYFLQ